MIIKSAEQFGLSAIPDSEERERKSHEKLIGTISGVSNEFVKAFDEFLDGLINELGI